MKINKIRPKFHFFDKNRNNDDLPCVCGFFLFTVFRGEETVNKKTQTQTLKEALTSVFANTA